MTRKQIEKAADRACALLLDIASDEQLEISGDERDSIAKVRDLCREIVDGGRGQGSTGDTGNG